MRYVRHIEDGDGNLVEIFYYCCAFCYHDDRDLVGIPGGWWPCLDSELAGAEPCRVCGEFIGVSTEIETWEPDEQAGASTPCPTRIDGAA